MQLLDENLLRAAMSDEGLDIAEPLMEKQRHWKDLYTQLSTKTRDLVVSPAEIHEKADARNTLLGEIKRMKEVLVGVRSPGMETVLAFHAVEVRALLDQIKQDARVILALSKGQGKSLHREMESHRFLKDLYEKQTEYVQELERAKARAPAAAPRGGDASYMSGGGGGDGDAAMRMMQEFCRTTQHELEVEKMQWRTRCLTAEEQLKTMEAYVKTVEMKSMEKDAVRRKQR